MIPLLSSKPFAEYDPPSYKAYIESLYKEPERDTPTRDWNVRLNEKGSPVLTIRNRKPQWLLYSEAAVAAKEIGWLLQPFLDYVRKRKIELTLEVRT